MAKHKVRLCIYMLISLILMLIIFIFSAQDASASQKLSDGILYNLLSFFHVEFLFEHFGTVIRKLAHFVLYFSLGLSTVLMFYEMLDFTKLVFPAPVSAFVVCFLYAISDEIHQFFVPGRSMQVSDVILDSVGAVTAILLCNGIKILFYKHREERKENE